MVELITSRITATALWIPESWMKCGLTEKMIEAAVVHAIHEKQNEITVLGKDDQWYSFGLWNEPLVGSEERSHRGVVEINEFTVDTMTRHYVSLAQVL